MESHLSNDTSKTNHKWRKVAYGGMQPGFDDNHTDESFLEDMIMNANVVKRDLVKVMLDSISISQYLCIVALVVLVWTYTLRSTFSESSLVLLDVILLGAGESSSSSFQTTTAVKNPRKKRTPINVVSGVSKPKPARKPDPFAPKITRPCTECGRKFWSWKALFGHMRCHPEREWRGINPPPDIRRRATTSTEEDYEVANCLLLLANGPTSSDSITTVNQENNMVVEYGGAGLMGCRFECSSCKKVFGSHQALGGHRASHKNVKGCYAINKDDGELGIKDDQDVDEEDGFCIGLGLGLGGGGCNENNNCEIGTSTSFGGHHECSICLRVFSSGQALGGHKRCHWESKAEEEEEEPRPSGGFDLNFPVEAAPIFKDEIDGGGGGSAGVLALDLRLGL
ncbi:hypothetical protein RD792_016487 [Penstemon davidsonii]|uniref:C2H2-type domain-containing protein n=1 Tax=Penstemon davidsonii TaxID=160366 RepID=A0ABR0CJH1_9LAMI|nr:hypothetical protein RD792_016487 [Penstemon davidsonii]